VAVDEKLDVHGVGVAGGDGHDQRLVHGMNFLAEPAVDTVKVGVHRQTIDFNGWEGAGEGEWLLRLMSQKF
jgi:hypothetical protein